MATAWVEEIGTQVWVIVMGARVVNIYHLDRREVEIFKVWSGRINKKELTGNSISPPRGRDYTPFKKETLNELLDKIKQRLTG